MALKTSLQKVGTTAADIVSNQAESGVSLKVTSLFVSNVLSEDPAEVDIEVARAGSYYSLIKGGSIPAGKTLSVFISKDIGLYLEEGDSIRLKSSSENSLEAVCSYEEIAPDAI